MAKNSKEEQKAVQDIQANRERVLELEKQIGDLRKSLASYSEKEIQSNEKALKISEEIAKLYEERAKYKKEEIVDNEKMLSQEKEKRKLSLEEFKRTNEISDLYSEIEDKSETLLESLKLRSEQQDTLNSAVSLAKGLQDAVNTAIRKGVTNSEEFAKAGELGLSAISGIVEMEEALSAAQDSALKGEFQKVNVKRQENRLRELGFLIEENYLELSGEQLDDLRMTRDALQASVDKAKELNGAYKEIAEETNKIQESGKLGGELLGKAFDGAKSIISKIPGGDMLLKAFKFDDIQTGIEQKMGGAMNGFIEGFKSDSGGMFDKLKGGLSGLKDGFASVGNIGATGMNSVGGAASGAMKAASMGATGFGMSLAAATAGITLIIAGVMKLVQIFFEADQAVADLGKDLGISKKEAIGVHEAAVDLSTEMNMAGVHAKEVAEGMKAVSENLGGIDLSGKFASGDAAVTKMVRTATLLSTQFQLSGEEVGNVSNLAAIAGVSVEQLSATAVKLGKGVFTAKDSMKILAGIPPSIMASMSKMPEALIKTAQKAKMLGMSMKDVAAAGRQSLDIESSLEAEMEARVLLGREINLDKMRMAALNGREDVVMEELLKNVGSMADFNKMNVIQKEALAKATGMEVDKIAEMLGKQEQLNTLGLDAEGLSKLQAKSEEEILAMKRAGNSEADKAYNLALEQEAANVRSKSLQENMESMMTRIKELAVKIVNPILDMVSGFDGSNKAAGGFFAILGEIFSVLGSIVKIGISPIVFAFDLISAILGPIFDQISSIFSVFSSGESTLGGISGIFGGISSVITTIFDTISDVVRIFVTGLLEPSKILLTAIITPIWNAFTGIYDAISKAFEPLGGAKEEGEETLGIIDMIKKAFEYISPVISFIGGLIASLIAEPLKLIGGLISSVVQIFTGDFEGGLTSLGETLMGFITSIPIMLLSGIASAIDAIFGTNLTESVGSFFGWVEKGFKTVYGLISPFIDLVQEIGGYVIDYLIQPFKSVWGIVEGIGMIFSGDLMGGLETIGTAILDLFLAPVELIQNVFNSILDFIIGSLIDAVKNIVPDWLIEGIDWVLGGGGGGGEEGEESPEKAAAETKGGGQAVTLPEGEMPAAAAGGQIDAGGLVLVGEQGPELVQLPTGASVASTGAGEQAGAILSALGLGGMGGATGQESAGGEEDKTPMEALIEYAKQTATAMSEFVYGKASEEGEEGGSIFQQLLDETKKVVFNVEAFVNGMDKLVAITEAVYGVKAVEKTEKSESILGSMTDALGSMFGIEPTEMEGEDRSIAVEPVTQTASPMGGFSGGIATGFGAVVDTLFGGGGEKENKSSGVEQKLDTLISIMTQVTTTPTIIKFGEKTVEEIQSQMNLKKSVNIAVDNTYGKGL